MDENKILYYIAAAILIYLWLIKATNCTIMTLWCADGKASLLWHNYKIMHPVLSNYTEIQDFLKGIRIRGTVDLEGRG